MKANELRIGNILMFTDSPAKREWIIRGQDIAYAEKDPEWLNLFFDPIPLNEEWLERFGFEKYDQMGDCTFWATRDERFHIKDIDIGIFNGDVKFKFGGLGWDYGIYLKYVHQFQNIIYALTCEELTLQK